MPLPVYIQTGLRRYDNHEADWGDRNNSRVMDDLAYEVTQHNDEVYVLSHDFASDMRDFAPMMYTVAQLQANPTPLPDRTCRNAINSLRRRIRSGRFGR